MTMDGVDTMRPSGPARPADPAVAGDGAGFAASAADASVDATDPVNAAGPAASVDGTAGASGSVASADVEGADADGVDAAAELRRVRVEIERIDRGIIGLIAERVALAREVGPLKQALGMPILDPPREAAVVRRAGELAREAGLPDEDVRYVFWHLVGLGRRVQLEEG
ncbi:MAG TPA: chorismate mutase [Longimicrobium sp.]|nr:chorismate mutase [Longimicrobium sp.]